jgi:hypothetical protein
MARATRQVAQSPPGKSGFAGAIVTTLLWSALQTWLNDSSTLKFVLDMDFSGSSGV